MIEKSFIWDSSKDNFLSLLAFAVTSVLLYTSYFSSQNIIIEIYDQFGYSNLGKLIVLCFYLGNSLGSIVFPGILKYFTFRTWFFFSGVAFMMLQLSFIFTCFCNEESGLCSNMIIYSVNITFGLIVGLANSLNWLSQAGYVTNISNSNTKTKFFSLFYALFNASLLFSALITIAVLDYSQSQLWFFIFAAFLSLLTSFFYLLIPDVPFSNFVADPQKPNFQRIKYIMKLFWKKINRKVTHLSLFVGIEIGFYVSFLYSLIEDTLEYENDIDTNLKTAYVFIFLGIFEIIGGLMSFMIGTKEEIGHLIKIGFLSLGIAFSFSFLILYSDENYIYCFLIAGLTGFGDCILQSMINVIVSYEENDVENFAHYIATQNFGTFVSVLFSLLLSTSYYMMFLIISYFICFLCVLYFK